MLTLMSLTVNASQCYNLDDSQVRVLNKAYQMGKEHNLGYTMMAIAMEESTAGKFRMSFESRDYGVMQNNLKTAASRTGTTGYYKKLKLAEKLILDDKLSMELALEELLYWKRHTPNWRAMVSAYNNGWAWDKGSVYLNKIIKHVKTFMNCWEEPQPMLQIKQTQRIIDYYGAVIVLPDGVNYVAMDLDGQIYGFEEEPMEGFDAWITEYHYHNAIHLTTVENPDGIHWADTLMEIE